MNSNWIIRPAQPNDIPFLFATWGKSYRYDSLIGKGCKNSVFYPNYNKVIDWILGQHDTKTIVAVLPDDQNVIIGYMVYQPNVIHYAFTKEAFHRLGVATSLYKAADSPKYISQKTFHIIPILKKYPELVFNPFVLFHKEGENHGSRAKEIVSEERTLLCGS